MAIVTIDSTWLSNASNSLNGNGVAPYQLATDHTNYKLAADVNVTTTGYFGQVFVFTGKDIYLDLNGFSVRVNGVHVPQERLSQRASANAYKAVPGNMVINQGGVVHLPNDTDQEISLDSARDDLPIVNPEAY